MKPSWKDAPDWAQWLAMDEDGQWHWYSDKPYYSDSWCMWNTEKQYEKCNDVVSWERTLQERPEDEKN